MALPFDTLIDRAQEQRQLRRLVETGTPQLALVTGRRRVGKTYLLARAWERERTFLFTAARTTPEINRRQLLEDLAGWSGEPIHPEDYPTWRAVFNLLLDLRTPEPVMIVLDEVQYLADDADGLAAVATELNAAWERRRAPRPLLLVLSGSAVATIEALAAGGGPLYGRFAWQHRLQPFDHWHAAEMTAFDSFRDRALVYGIFGGTPRYLAAVDVTSSLQENVTRLMLEPSGEVRLLVETALDQEDGLRDVAKYRAIVRAVSSGCTERNEIAQRTGLGNDNGLRDKLARLVELGYIETRQNIDAKPNESVRYGIADPAFRFHQRFVEPAVSMLERYPAERIWSTAVAPQLDAYMGLEFERIVTQAYDRRSSSLALPIVAEWGRWEGVDRSRRALEIDIVARLAGGGVMSGAIKWNRSPIDARVHHEHIAMLRRAADAGRAWAHEVLDAGSPLFYVAAGGFTDDFLTAVRTDRPQAVCWTLDDIYAP